MEILNAKDVKSKIHLMTGCNNLTKVISLVSSA
jgi:hypothetical protein